MRLQISVYLFALALIGFFAQSAQADTVNISMSGPEFITLSEDAASVIVGNPAYVSVAIENPRHIMLMPKAQGMTNVVVLGHKGNVIFNEAVIVGGPRDNYIRIQNACINGGRDCQPMKTFYCEPGQRCQDLGGEAAQAISGRRGGGASAGAVPAGNTSSAPTSSDDGVEE